MMIILLVFLIGCALSVVFRLIVLHPYGVIYYGLLDLLNHFKNKVSNECPYGTIKCYIAHRGTAFGTGKTLSATREIVQAYNRYNGKPVWCPRRERIVTQRVHILSNVDFTGIPFERLESLSQFVGETDTMQDYDDLNDCLTVTYLLIDEASSQLNSRSFKSNFDAPFISRLLTSRHVRANLVLTSQRSGMVDKLMRDCCNYYISCQKIWRFEILRYYDAYSIECAQEPDTVPPMRRTGYFIKDGMFRSYDTFASVKALEKSCKEGDMLTEEQILTLRVGDSLEQATTKRQARKARKRKR
jgi:hypothetical protein